jgi:hypothetical protein
MFCGKLCSLKYLIGTVLALMALVAFNLGRPRIETDTAAEFNSWYKLTAEKLNQTKDVQRSDLAVQVRITLREPTHGDTPTVWLIPSTSLADTAEREATSRVLQLIRESGVFGLPSTKIASDAPSSISINLKDANQQFEITLPYHVVENNIRLQNLLTFLQVYSAQRNTPSIEPARL